MSRLIRTSTVALSLDYLLKGQLNFLNRHFEVLAVSGKDRHLQNVADREGVRVFSLGMNRAIRPVADLISLWRLYRLFKKERPEIVHSITPKAGLLSMVAAKMAGVPIRMHTFTGLIFPSKKGVFQKLLIVTDRLLCWAATNVYPEGNGVMNDLIHYKITSKPLKVLANGNVNGIDTAYFSSVTITSETKEVLKAKLAITQESFTFVFVGRLVGDKGINELVQAFNELTIPNIRLILVGSYEHELDPLKLQTLSKIEENPNIFAVGFQNDVRPYLAVSDCLVFPSYREGFPNVVMQAGAMNLPAIVTDINGCNEIIVEGINGTIIPPKNTELLHLAMLEMINNSDKFSDLKANARQMIISRFEQKVVWEELLKEYKRLQGNVH